LYNATSPGAGGVNDPIPKAYLTVLFFDERFNFIGEGSATDRVDAPGNGSDRVLVIDPVKAPRNGYAFVYLSNESDEHVYFDNLKVQLRHKHIIEENHYYAYGLRIAGISSRKMGDAREGQLDNPYQYQGDYSEFDDETGWNDFALRSYDPQTGRFINANPYDQFASPYVGMGNDPVNNIDEDGGWAGFVGMAIGAAVGFATPYAIEELTGKHIENKGLKGLFGAFLGAGIGYGAGASLGGGGSFLNETKAFYASFFGVTPGTEIGGARSSIKCPSVLKGGRDGIAIVPDMRGLIGNMGSIFEWVESSTPKISTINIAIDCYDLIKYIIDENQDYPVYNVPVDIPDDGNKYFVRLNNSGSRNEYNEPDDDILSPGNHNIEISPNQRHIMSLNQASKTDYSNAGFDNTLVRRNAILEKEQTIQNMNKSQLCLYRRESIERRYKYLKIFKCIRKYIK
jgi:RHS repeat-associated protein